MIDWFVVKFSKRDFAIFDTFPDESGPLAHLAGKVAANLRLSEPAGTVPPSEDLATFARRLYSERRRLSQLLPDSLRGDAAWDMCLHLFAAHHDDIEVTTAAAIAAAQASPATGLRLIAAMTDVGLIHRERTTRHRTINLVKLTEQGLFQMAALLATLASERAEFAIGGGERVPPQTDLNGTTLSEAREETGQTADVAAGDVGHRPDAKG